MKENLDIDVDLYEVPCSDERHILNVSERKV